MGWGGAGVLVGGSVTLYNEDNIAMKPYRIGVK